MIAPTPVRLICFVFGFLLICVVPTGRAQTPAPPADPHDQIQQILQRPDFQRWRLRQDAEMRQTPAAVESLQSQLGWLREKINDFLERLLRRSVRSGSVSAPGTSAALVKFLWAMGWIALTLFLVAIVVLIVRIVRGMDVAAGSAVVLSREQVAGALQEGDALALGGDQWLDEASRLARNRNFRAMYRALYLALLSGLHAAGKIDFDKHRTNWTYVNRYRGDPDEKEIFSSMTDLFDGVWYGLKDTEADVPTLQEKVRRLIAAPTASTSGSLGAGNAK